MPCWPTPSSILKVEVSLPTAAIADIVAAGFDESVVRNVVRMIRTSEYKRRQSPVGIRVTHRSFGRDWRYPITNRFREENASL